MHSLANIWDEPAESAPRPPALFLADSDDELPPGVPQPTDIDAMFADLEDDAFNFEPVAPPLDVDALQREADARHRNATILAPHAILPTSSPPRATGPDDGRAQSWGKDGKAEPTKERRKPVRLDEGRLLGPSGFPQLIKDTKNFKTKGKGHEATDLNRLLQVYQFWTHRMYPKTQFKDTVQRVEKLCHSKRMNVALSVWRDEAHGLVNGRRPEDIIDLSDDDNAAATNNDGSIDRADAAPASTSLSDAAEDTFLSRPPSQPPTSETEPDDDDDFDIDAIIREEDERAARERAAQKEINSGNPSQPAKAAYNTKDSSAMDVDDDEAMWNELNASALPDEDENMWNVVKEIENEPRPTTSVEVTDTISTTAVASDLPDDWEDIYV